MVEVKNLIKKYTLQNAVRYNGKANPGAIIGKILQEQPKLKKEIKNISKEIIKIAQEVNSLPLEKQQNQLKDFTFKKKVKKQKTLPKLETTNKVVMRFEPSPSGALHIGHALVLSLNYLYCKNYNGKLILRISDTNPELIYTKAYKLIEEDSNWLTNNSISRTIIQSDNIKVYYKYAEKLIQLGKAYVCTCNPEKFKKLINKRIACPCRNKSKIEQKERWEKMFTDYRPGQAVLRIKTNLMHNNPAIRDWPAFRINTKKHPRTKNKFRVWPLMNFSVAIDDHEEKITASIRAKDHQDNAKKQKYIYNHLKWEPPQDLYIGRINFTDKEISSRKISEAIQKKKFSSWDDIRLPSLQALKRRGYQPEAFLKYAEEQGISKTDKTTTTEEFFKIINAHNKEIIDKTSNRYFFIQDPVKVKIENAPSQKIGLGLHPDYPKRGMREFNTTDEFYLQKKDLRSLKKGRVYRLMDCLNFTKKEKRLIFHSTDYETYKQKGDKIMHWLPTKDNIKIEVTLEDGKTIKGLGEPELDKVKKNTIIQFERFAFVKFEKKEKNKHIYLFTHT